MRCRAEWAPDIFAGESRTDWETQERVPIGEFQGQCCNVDLLGPGSTFDLWTTDE